MSNRPLNVAEIEDRLDELLDPVLTSRRTATPLARALAGCERMQQDFVLNWVDIICRTNAEMAYQFAAYAPSAFHAMSAPAVEAWIIHAMDIYDEQGLYPGCAAIKDVSGFAADTASAARGVALEAISPVLELFVRGLAGRPLKIDTAEIAYTDTETLYLPTRLSVFTEHGHNLRLYKIMAAHLWAQTWYGTYQLHDETLVLAQALTRFTNAERALTIVHALETVRINARLARDLPGLYRDLVTLQTHAGNISYPHHWELAMRRLQQPASTLRDSIECAHELYAGELPATPCYQGVLVPGRAEDVIQARLAREKQALRIALAQLAGESRNRFDAAQDDGRTRNGPPRYELAIEGDADQPQAFRFALSLDGSPLEPPAEVQSLIASILQDLSQVPEDYLVAAGDGAYRRDEGNAKRPEDVWKGTYHEEGAFLYNEWDHKRKHYRKDWCVLRELDVHPRDDAFVHRTLKKYGGVLAGLRKTFEALRGEDRLLKREPTGDDIDFDALIEAYADLRTGRELSERLFTKPAKLERNIAVMFMVDMSGSTKGWINDAERESLVLLCEALEILGDRYAIYGFSGMTRKRCELYRIKRFDEPYSEQVRQRISGVTPQDYTRMGVTIRHLIKLLDEVEARTKLLITLSDGKPDDYDGYRGDYGIEDTRQALLEAKYAGIHPFCITIDNEARDYLPHMYGHVNWALIDDVRKLPVKVSEIYRKLTL